MAYATMREMPAVLKPRERLIQRGPSALRDHELLAVMLGSGIRGRHVLDLSAAILEQHPDGALARLGFRELQAIRGIGPAKACTLLAATELVRRWLREDDGALPIIASSQDAADQVPELRRAKKEHFLALYLNARNQLIAKETISVGTLTANLVHPREVFQPAISHSAASVLLVHNHPSGDPAPSPEDLALTQRLAAAGELMGIAVLDHVIVGDTTHVSLKDQGHL
ncbi:MAG: DNA repair protein RadC [Candidatus Omnitrophica bacterium]|nr:DNA repair protein RadC [Candidatus Omnitrophota bacterium]